MKRKQRAATPRQSAILEAIAALTRELRRAPSATEIAARIGVTRVGILPQLKALEAKGLAADEPKMVRSGKWKLTRPGKAHVGAIPEAALPPAVLTAAELDAESWEDFPYIATPGEPAVATYPLSVLDTMDEPEA